MLAAKTITFKSTLCPILENSNGFALPMQNSLPFSKYKHNIPCLKSSTQSIISPKLIEPPSSQSRVKIVSETLSFIERFQGKTIVVKYGGAAMNSEELQASVIDDIVHLSSVGIRIVLFHGGGPEINMSLAKRNIEPAFHNGHRVTDAQILDVVSDVLMKKVNPRLVALINKAGATAVGLSEIKGRLLTACPSQDAATLGFVGDIERVDPSILHSHIEKNHIPVIAPLAADMSDQLYNINADTVAGEIAVALGAEKLILLTDVPGILVCKDDPGTLVKKIDIKGVERMMKNGKIVGGMMPKVNCCMRSLDQGVRTTHIIDGRMKHSLLLEILTDEGAGTMIVG